MLLRIFTTARIDHWSILVGVMAIGIGATPALIADDSDLQFGQVIRPILQQKCGDCHDGDSREGGLDLSSLAGLKAGGESGDSILAESLSDSRLHEVIDSGEMPPDGESPLTESQRQTLFAWIASGDALRELATLEPEPLNQHDILPIMLLRCTACHGAQVKEGDLDLRTTESMFAERASGPVLIQGDADQSLLVQRVESNECPPADRLLKSFVRRPSSNEVETLRQWIDAGAPVADAQPSVAGVEQETLVTDEDRRHWAFQRPKSIAGGSIDQFVADKLQANGLEFSPPADRATLIRRLWIDLIGMPPDRQTFIRWQQSDDPLWYRKLVDQLLASPRYGERWGRYWLDLAGYADSEGGVATDPVRPVAWKYRDYVIEAFNSDLPYDQFLIQQLAGDELLDYEHAPEVTEEMVRNLVATGFLRMGIDETGSRTMNFVPERLKVISDAIKVVSSSIMGLTMECARCHSHKYDPIPLRDYYRFKAIFQGALDEHDWSSFKTRSLDIATPEHRQHAGQVNPPIAKEITRLEKDRKQLVNRTHLELLQYHHPDQSVEDNQHTLAALKLADNNRTLVQRNLVQRLLEADLLADDRQPESVLAARAELQRLDRRLDLLRHSLVPATKIRALWDQGRPSPTYVLHRGEPDRPGQWVGPDVPSVLSGGTTPLQVREPFPGGTKKTGRRLAFAKWLTQPDHPLTARVMVNRVWYHHFGSALASELDNFGRQADPPSHPELLDTLAREFVDRRWSIKSLHRLILNSRTYRQSSQVDEDRFAKDPTNRWFSRMPLSRLDAESLRDTLLSVSGTLEETPHGLPDAVSVSRDGLVSVNRTAGGGWRRSVYLQFRRTEIPTMMDTFDYPRMGPNCVARNTSNISPQSLMLMNNQHVRDLAESFAGRIASATSSEFKDRDSLGQLVEWVYQSALTRDPSAAERTLGVDALIELRQHWGGDFHAALTTYCHSILNSADFLYVD